MLRAGGRGVQLPSRDEGVLQAGRGTVLVQRRRMLLSLLDQLQVLGIQNLTRIQSANQDHGLHMGARQGGVLQEGQQ